MTAFRATHEAAALERPEIGVRELAPALLAMGELLEAATSARYDEQGGHSMSPRNVFSAFAMAAACGMAFADQITGRVVDVVDGDTIVVRSAGGATHRVRVAGADAPERGQGYSAQAKRRMESLTLGKGVVVEPAGKDRDGAISGRVRVNGRDLGSRLVREGAAWHDRQQEQTPAERARYSAAQREAKERRSGLWAGDDPEEPWLLRERRHGRHQGDR